MQQIFPKEIVENTKEVHHAKHGKKRQWIYVSILFALLAVFVLLPFVKVSIHKVARGIIKPEGERFTIQTTNGGRVLEHFLEHNKTVQKGDTLLVLSSQSLSDKEINVENQIKEILLFVDDLEGLLKNEIIPPQSSKYHQELLLFTEKKNELEVRQKKCKKDYDVDLDLFRKEVVPEIEVEEKKLAYELAQSATCQFQEQQRALWEGQLISYREQLRTLSSSLSQVQESQGLSVLVAPVSGTLLDVVGIGEGSMLSAGMKLANLSPDTTLCVECYLTPEDIGLLRPNNKAKFQVDAFNYNQWGLATGEIKMISNDVQLIDGAPVFKVHCKLSQGSLYLKNGFEGKLKKGMTLTARFEITERSLFQLLYDKVDDWLNPNVVEISQKI